MYIKLYICGMSYEEKGVWVYLVAGLGSYAVYLVIVLGQAARMPLVETAYVVPLLATIGLSMALAIVGRIVLEMVRPSDNYRRDDRDRAIHRLGEYRGQWFLVAGALGALVLALIDSETFWIANIIYLSFHLSALTGSILKLVSYRRGF